MEFMESSLFNFVILPLLIFVMRICDVSLDTMRIIFMTKGYKKVVPVIGFFEVLIWIVAITRIMENLNNWITYIAYAAGFATGNYVGMLLDEKLAIGHEMIRIITRNESGNLADVLRKAGFGVTTVQATGMQGEVGIHYIIVNRKNLKMAIGIIEKNEPSAFYTIENIHFVNRPLDKNIVSDGVGSRIFPFGRS